MNRVTITVHIDLPDGAVPDVGYSAAIAPAVAEVLQSFDDPPLPDAPPPDLYAVPSVHQTNPPICSIHRKPMTYRPAGAIKSGPKAGQPRGAFWSCGEKDANGVWCKSRQDAA